MFDNENISLNDPNHQYTVVGIVPAVFMVNTEALGERPMPESWSDLMKSEYEKTSPVADHPAVFGNGGIFGCRNF